MLVSNISTDGVWPYVPIFCFESRLICMVGSKSESRRLPNVGCVPEVGLTIATVIYSKLLFNLLEKLANDISFINENGVGLVFW